MKKKFSLFSAAICMTIMANAQKITVPDAVKTAFSTKYTNAVSVKWGMENAREYEADFKLNGITMSANFGPDGTWKETETAIAVNNLPAAVSAAISTKYPGAVITGADKIEKPVNNLYYEAVVKVNGKKKNVELNPDGTFIK